MQNINNKQSGYTIIETMISVSLFLIIVMIAMGSLVNANLLHQKSQSMRSIIDNLNFVMEDMSRNLRTGYNYNCYDSGWSQSLAQTSGLNTPQNCTNGGVIVFEEAHGNTPLTPAPNADPNATDQWIYKIESTDGGVTYNIFKSVKGGTLLSWVQLNPSEVVLSSVSSFTVSGAEPLPGDSKQPFVTIKLVGAITFKGIETPFSLQTSVSQRVIDNIPVTVP